MDRINEGVNWYQQKIGAYDRQLWEDSVERKCSKNLQHLPKKATFLKPELIDVDLVRGSTFTKTKPQHSLPAVIKKGLLRTIFLPLYYKWWVQQTSARFTLFLLVLYILQVFSVITCVCNLEGTISVQTISLVELVTPSVLMAILGIIHAQIVATHKTHKPLVKNDAIIKKCKRKPRNKKLPKTPKDGGGLLTGARPRRQSLEREVVISQQRQMTSFSLATTDSRSETDSVHTPSSLGQAEADKTRSTATSTNTLKPNITDNDKSDDNDQTLQQSGNSSSCSGSDVNFEVLSHDQIPCKTLGGAECISYTSLDESDTTTCNTQENITVLKGPLVNVVGEILPYTTGAEQLPTRYNGTTELAEKEVNIQYMLSNTDKSNGQINLVGLSKGKAPTEPAIGRNHTPSHVHSRPVTSSHVHSRTDEMPDPESEGAVAMAGIHVPDPVITFNDFMTQSDQPEEILDRSHSDKDLRYIPSTPEIQDNDYDAVDLGGNKRKQQLSSLKRRRRSFTGVDKPMPGRGRLFNRKTPTFLPIKIKSVPPQSTGVSSCESGAETPSPRAVQTPKGQISEVDWEDNMASEMASSDSSSCSSTDDDDDKEGEQEEPEELPEDDDPFNMQQGASNHHTAQSIIVNAPSDKVSCVIWEGNDCKKIDLSTIDIGWSIINKVDSIPECSDYVTVGILLSVLMCLVPSACRLYQLEDRAKLDSWAALYGALLAACGHSWRSYVIIANGIIQRCCLCSIFFFLLSVAERTFKQRLLYAKNFCYLTSTRRSKKYDLPHFRLNKVRNIKSWLSLRSYLKKRGPQRSVNVIVSATFLIAILLLSLMCFQLLKDSGTFANHLYNWELVVWVLALGMYLLRYMTLGLKINKKYRNLSVLITEQMNLYLHMEQKPHKKEELMLANNVLKLAEDLIKELESPFKISGISANPFLYNVTKFVVLSAFSATLSELLGFKLRLYKIKLGP